MTHRISTTLVAIATIILGRVRTQAWTRRRADATPFVASPSHIPDARCVR